MPDLLAALTLLVLAVVSVGALATLPAWVADMWNNPEEDL